jgi:hypothetical protein
LTQASKGIVDPPAAGGLSSSQHAEPGTAIQQRLNVVGVTRSSVGPSIKHSNAAGSEPMYVRCPSLT